MNNNSQADRPLLQSGLLLPMCAFILTMSFLIYQLNFLRILTAVRMAFGMTSSFFFSAAILGLGVGSMVVVLNKERFKLAVILPLIPVAMVVSYVVIYLLLRHEILLYQIGTWQHFISYSFLFMPLISTPFILAGLALAKLFTLAAGSRKMLLSIRAADLLGAAIGGLLPIILLDVMSPLYISIIPLVLGALLALTALKFNRKHLTYLLVCSAVLLIFTGYYLSTWNDFNTGFISAITFIGQKDSPFERADLAGWSPYHRINYRKEGPNIHLYYNSAPITYILKHDQTPPAIDEVSWPFKYAGHRDSTLVIGAGGGKEVRFAQEITGSSKVKAIELDPVVVDLVNSLKDHAPYIHNPGVSFVQGEGRHYLSSGNETYDHIVYALIDSPSTISAQSMFKPENYIYTVESFKDAYRRLNDDGLLTVYSLVTYPPDSDDFSEMALKLYRNLSEATGDPDNVAIYDFSDPDNRRRTGSVFLLYQKGGLDMDRLDGYAARSGKISDIPEFRQQAQFVTPNYDKNPFIYIDRKMPTILISFLAEILLFAVLIIGSLVYVAYKRFGPKLIAGSPVVFVYFFFTGFGFMLLEVVLIHKLVVSFGAPHLSSSVVISTLLIGMGMTSLYLGLKKQSSILVKPTRVFALMAGILIFLPYYVDLLNGFLLHYTLGVRTIITIAMLLPVGLLLGLPFPVGFNFMRKRSPEGVVLAYAIDIFGSVFGIVGALVIPMIMGYPFVFGIIVVSYIIILVTQRSFLSA
jgi:hypothetical protein